VRKRGKVSRFLPPSGICHGFTSGRDGRQVRLMPRNESIRSGTVCSTIAHSVRIGPPQPKYLSFQQYLRTPQPSELTKTLVALSERDWPAEIIGSRQCFRTLATFLGKITGRLAPVAQASGKAGTRGSLGARNAAGQTGRVCQETALLTYGNRLVTLIETKWLRMKASEEGLWERPACKDR